MKARGVIISFLAMVVFFASYACANEPEPQQVSSAKPVMVPYLNKSISEVNYEYEFVTDGNQPEADGDRDGSGEDSESDVVAAVLKNTGRMEGGEGMQESVPELVESESVSEAELEGQLGEHSGYAEDGYSDGYADESEVESEPNESAGRAEDSILTYLGEWTTTAYCSCEICCGQWATGCTASGVLATPNHTVACGILPFGTQIVIDDVIYTVEDTGVDGAWIDIYFDSHEQALAYGMQTKSVYLIN